MTDYEAYCLYVSIKNHFSRIKYDYFLYNGKSKNTNINSFNKRNDKIFFLKLSKHEDVLGFLVSNIIIKKDIWIRELVYNEQSYNNYKKWIKKHQSLTYNFTQDLNKLNVNFKSNFIVKNNDHPELLKLYFQNEISLETLCILLDITGTVEYFNKRLKDDVVWEDISLTTKKYLPFIKYDKEKYTKLCIDKFS